MRRKSPPQLIAAFVVSVLAATGVGWLTVDAQVDVHHHEIYDRALRRAVKLDAQLNEQVAESNMGFVTHYDDLVWTWDQISAVRARLHHVPEHVTGLERAALEGALADYEQGLMEKQRLLEHFKTEQAVLRNAMTALPYSVERLEAERALTPSSPALARLPELLNAVLLNVVSPTPERTLAAQCGLTLLGGVAAPECDAQPLALDELSPHLQSIADAVHRQGELALDRQVRVRELVQSLMTLPTTEAARQATAIYTSAHAEALERSASRGRLAAALSALSLLLGATLIIARTQADARSLRELTERLREAMTELRVERDKEKELAQVKSRFVSMTSHEFRTPLSVILSSTDLLLSYGKRWDDTRKHKHLRRILSSGVAMSRMIEGVLLIGRADADMMDLKPKQVNLRGLVQDVIAEVQTTVSEDRLLDLTNDAPQQPLLLDEELIRHVLTNLLSNAFKYSPPETTVSVRVGGDEEHACFEVSDQGIGIAPDDLATLFEPFHRGSNASEIPGTGLGLAIVKRSVERHGGSVDVESQPGKGSCFRVRIPVLSEAV